MVDTKLKVESNNDTNTVQAITYKINYNPDGSLKSILQYIDHTKKNKKFIYILTWVFVLMLLLLLTLFIIIIAGVVIFYGAARPAIYGEECTRRSCVKGLNMKCIDYQCTCLSNQYYSRGCKDKKSYLEQCGGDSLHCEDNRNLTCIDGVCKCNSDVSYWNGQKCIFKKSYKETCQTIQDCLDNLILDCNPQRKQCLCSDKR